MTQKVQVVPWAKADLVEGMAEESEGEEERNFWS